jgi:hypothetical protein
MVVIMMSNAVALLSGMKKLSDANEEFRTTSFEPFCSYMLNDDNGDNTHNKIDEWLLSLFEQEDDEDPNSVQMTDADYDWILKMLEVFMLPPKKISKKEYNTIIDSMNNLTKSKSE